MKIFKTIFCLREKLSVALVVTLAANVFSATPTISNVAAQQRYPWNGKVDITFEVVGDMTAGVPESNIPVLTLSATDNATGTKYIASESALSGDIGAAEGMHHVVWDLNAQNIEFKSDGVVVSVMYVEPQYCVVDLSAGAKATAYPVSYLADVPPGGWTDEYKTSKLVLRRIAPGSFKSHGTIQYGSQYLNNQAYDVTLTKPYFIGAFEVTQRQYELVTGEKPSYFTNRTYYATRPVDCVSYTMIRGASAGAGWPGSSAVDASSFMGKLRARTQIDGFDLPTDAQWEYACRAGTTTDYNNGKNMTGEYNDVNLNEVGRYQANRNSPVNRNRNTSYGTAKVGSYLPNAWGIYDMHGNVNEWCLDWYRDWYPSEYMTGVTDPDGLSSVGGNSRIFRGGSWQQTADYCTSSKRNGSGPSYCGGEYGGIGFRIVRTLSNVEVESYSELNWADVACSGNSSAVAIDSRIGVRESLGNETITYSSLWNESGGATVTIEQDGVVLAEDLAGSGEIPWRVNYDGVFALTHTTYTNGIAGERLLATFLVDRVNLDPLIIEPSGGEFANVSQTISLSCATDGAKIYYTTDGSDPRTNGREYTKPFTVYKSCTVRAVSSIDGWMEYPESTATFTRSESLSEAANLYGYTMETDEVVPWVVDGEVSRDGVSSVRSGAIGNNGTTRLQTSIKKAGTVSFWWKAACEEADEEEGEDGYYDYGAFLVDDVIVARIAGHDGEWHYVSHEITSGGKHTLKWEYRKDGSTTYAPDCVWVDQVQWIPADGSGYTLTTPEPVPYAWLDAYRLGVGTDYETAGNAASGKMQGGRLLQVWQDYVAGTDPTNLTSRFMAKINMVDGAPVVTWEPDLNTNGVIRAYKVYGKETLDGGGEWQYPTNSLHRFFKVTVEMP